jgi:hypothetical protein
MVDWGKVTVEVMLNAMDKMVKKETEGRFVFDVSIFNDDDTVAGEYAIVVENGKCAWTKGLSNEDGATNFEVKRGGVETLKAMQVEGLDAAMRFMFDGSISTNNPAGAQKWFKIFELGQDVLDKAVDEVLAGK